MSRVNRVPSGPSNSPSPTQIGAALCPRNSSSSPSLRKPVTSGASRKSLAETPANLRLGSLGKGDRLVEFFREEQMRVAALGARKRRADELPEQRRRPVGPALELGVCLRADPERVADQFDELDEPAVGRQP